MKYQLFILIILLSTSCKNKDIQTKSKDNHLKSTQNNSSILAKNITYKKDFEYISAFNDFKKGQLKESYYKFIELIKKHPNDIELNYHIGFIAAKSNNLPIAEKFLKKTIKLSPSKWEAYRDLASLYKSRYRYKDALEWVKKVFKYKDNDPISNFIMAYLSNKLEHNNNAYIYYERAIKFTKTYMLAYIHYGEFYFSRKQYNKAEKIWLEGLNKRYSNTIAQRLASLYRKEKKYDKAIIMYQKILKEYPQSSEPYFNIGKIYESKNNFKKAIEYYQKALLKNKLYDSPNIALADIYMKQNKLDEAFLIYKSLNEKYIEKTTFYLYEQAKILKIQKKQREFKVLIQKLKESPLKESLDYLQRLEEEIN